LSGPGNDLLDTPLAGPAAIRGGALRVLGYGASVLLSVVSAALLFRHLGVVDSGRYVLVFSLVTIVQGLTDAGITGIGTRELSTRTGADRERLIKNLLGMRLVLTVAGVALAVLFTVIAGYESVLVAGTALAGFGLVIQNLQSTLALSLMSGLRLGWVAALDLLRQFLVSVLIVALVIAGASLLAFLATPIPAAIVVLLLTALLVRSDVPVSPSFEGREWLVLARETASFAVATAVNVVYFRIAVVLVSLLAGATQTGYFGTSFRIIEVLVLVPSVMVGAAFPIFARAARDDHERLGYALQRTFEAATIGGVGLALALSLGASFAIDVIAGAGFGPAKEVLRLQAVSFIGSFPAAVFGYALLSLRRHRELLYVNLGLLAMTAALVSVLALADGARGAAIGTAAGEITLAIALGVALSRAAPQLRPSLAVLPKVALAGAAGAAVAFLPLSSLAMAIAGSLVFFAVLLLVRGIPEELIVELRRFARREAVA
jgi:O-antigen/teichoic acid export membrane protein